MDADAQTCEVRWEESDAVTQHRVESLGGAAALRDVVGQVLPGRSVLLRSIDQGISGAVVFLAYPTRIDTGTPVVERVGVLKIAPSAKLVEEVERYDRWVVPILEDTRSFPLLAHAKTLERSTALGAILYQRVGDATIGSRIRRLLADDDVAAAKAILERLFVVLTDWQDIAQKDSTRALTEAGIYSFGDDPFDEFDAICRRLNERYSRTSDLPQLIGFERVRELWKPGLLGPEKFLLTVTHGDLNTENVLVGPDDNLTLIDFAATGIGHFLRDLATFEAHLVLRATGGLDLDEDLRCREVLEQVLPLYSRAALVAPDEYVSDVALHSLVMSLRQHVWLSLMRRRPEYVPQYVLAVLRQALRITTRVDESMRDGQRFVAAHVALRLHSILEERDGHLRLQPPTTLDTEWRGSTVGSAGRPPRRYGADVAAAMEDAYDSSRLLHMLVEADAATFIGITNDGLAEVLDEALSRRKALYGAEYFWRALSVVFLAEELLANVDDDLTIEFPNAADALRERKQRAGVAKRTLMSLLLRSGSVGRWSLYSYPRLLPFAGALLHMRDGTVIADLALASPGAEGDRVPHLLLSNLPTDTLERAFRDLVAASREEHEIVLSGDPVGERFICRSSRFRRTVLISGRNTHDWLAAVLCVTWRMSTFGAPEPLLQVNTPTSSTREMNRISHVSGYINLRDHDSALEVKATHAGDGFVLPIETAFAAVQRELNDDLRISVDDSSPEYVGVVRFYYPDKENLFFFLFTLQLDHARRFPPAAHLHAWTVADLVRARKCQVYRNASILATTELTPRERSIAAPLLVANLHAHREHTLADRLAIEIETPECWPSLERDFAALADASEIERHAGGQRLRVDGLAGLQYRIFFSHLLPLYAQIGVPGADAVLAEAMSDAPAAKGIREIAEIYSSESLMSALPIEV